MSKLKELIKEANQIHEMRWKVLAFDPEQDNKLVHTSDTFDCIDGATKCKMNWKEKHPTHTIEIVAESIQNNEDTNIDVKHPGLLEVPDGKKVDELPQSHFEKLVDKKGYAEVIRALTNLEVWNKDKNKSLSSWASNMADKLKKKYRPESVQKNEADANSERTLIAKKKEIQKLASKMGNDNLVQYISLLKKYVDDAYDYALKHFDESAQKNETLDLRKLSSDDANKLAKYFNDFAKDKTMRYDLIDKIEDILKKKYKAESSQKNEDTYSEEGILRLFDKIRGYIGSIMKLLKLDADVRNFEKLSAVFYHFRNAADNWQKYKQAKSTLRDNMQQALLKYCYDNLKKAEKEFN